MRKESMQHMKRKLSTAAAIVLLITALSAWFAGCSGNSGLSDNLQDKKGALAGITINCAFIGGGDYEKLYDQLPEFAKTTGATVRIVYKGNGFDIDKKLIMDFTANTVDYDVMWNHTSFFSQYIPYLEPLDPYFSPDELNDFLPRLLNACKRDGMLWMIPRHADISSLHYRTDLFNDPKEKTAFKEQYGKELKVPETWEEFVEVAEFFTRGTSLYGTQFAGKEEALTGRFYELLLSNGGEFLGPEGKAAFNSEAGVKAISMLRELYASGSMPKGMVNYLWDDLASNFANGNIAIYPEWYGWYSRFQNPEYSKVTGKFDVARQPAGPGGIHGGWGGVHAFSIPKAAKNKEAAAVLIKFLTSPESEYKEGKLGYLVARTSIWDKMIKEAERSNVPLDKKRLELAKLQLSEDFQTPPLIAQWISSSNILFPRLQSVILGEIEPKTALDEAAAEINKLLESGTGG